MIGTTYSCVCANKKTWIKANKWFETNFVFCKTAVVVVSVDWGSICKLLSVDNSSIGRVGLDDAPVIAYANAAFVTLFWRRRWLCLNNLLLFCFCVFVWTCLCLRVWKDRVGLEWWNGRLVCQSRWAVKLEFVFYCRAGWQQYVCVERIVK